VKQAYLDRDNYGIVYKFIPTPVWFTIEVAVDPDLHKAWPLMQERFAKVNSYLDAVFEAARAGATPPELTEELKEIIKQCLAPAAAEPAKKQKPKATEAASNSASQSS
jgi:hypothetical protein